ncbi:MAG: ABC transporter permease [Pseudomonadota bacterium]|nr:ABC transporter permease [Pseudomonadota bacterium]
MPETLRAAFVIARRDFAATVMSKTFLFFLLGPLFPIVMGVMFGGIGNSIDSAQAPPRVAVIFPLADYRALVAARERLAPLAGDRPFVTLHHTMPEFDLADQRRRLLEDERVKLLGVLDGGLARPHFTGAVAAEGQIVRQLTTFVEEARRPATAPVAGPAMGVTLANSSSGSLAFARQLVARGAQIILFILTILLAGMLLSQLIEEKSNKVIEILAAAVPIDAIFLGKLFAMLAVSLIGIMVWTAAATAAVAVWADDGIGALPAPALGWPLFVALMLIYFAMSYLLIGGMFLGIGAQASTVREVQTLSMPVTMIQVLIFGFASIGVGKPGSNEALGAAIFPLSSPFAMIARAAEEDAVWPHLAALAWQALWVALILKIASAIFRRSVLKSGPSWRWPWQRKRPA